MADRAEREVGKESSLKNFGLLVVGLDVSFTKDGQLNTVEPEEETAVQALTLFGWAEGAGYKSIPLLTPFPLFEGVGAKPAAEIGRFMTENLRPAFAQINEVDQSTIRFPLLKDIAKSFDETLRHEAGYALLALSKKKSKQEVPQEFREAIWNTGNLLLRSVGVDWWIEEEKKGLIEEAYNQYFRPFWGNLPPLFNPEDTEMTISEFKLVLSQLYAMKDARTIKGILDYEEMAQLGHGFAFIAEHVAEKTELVFGPRWASRKSTPIGASWVGMQIRPDLQLPLPEPFS